MVPACACRSRRAMVWSDAHAILPRLELVRLDSTLPYQPPRALGGLRRGARLLVVRPVTAVVAAAMVALVPAWNPVWYQDDQLPTLFRILHTSLAHEWGVVYPRLAPEL